MKIDPKNPQRNKSKLTRIIKYLAFFLLIVLLLTYACFEVVAYSRFQALKNETESVAQQSIITQGGEFQIYSSHGATFYEQVMGCWDLRCPSITGSWVVPIEAGGDESFVKQILEKAGYVDIHGECVPREQLCGYFGSKPNHFRAEVDTRPAGNYDKIPTGQDIGQKQWRSISITITEN